MGRDKSFYLKEHKIVQSKHPNLALKSEKGNWVYNGIIDIIDEDDKRWDTYSVKVVFPLEYPKVVPKLYEVGGRIKIGTSNHINADGTCCLSTPAGEMIILKGKVTAIDFIDKLVVPFLANYTFKSIKGNYAGGEYDHFEGGIFQFYMETFSTDNLTIVRTILERLVSNKLPRRNEACLCGKGLKFKNCHETSIRKLDYVNRSILLSDLKTIVDKIKNNRQ